MKMILFDALYILADAANRCDSYEGSVILMHMAQRFMKELRAL